MAAKDDSFAARAEERRARMTITVKQLGDDSEDEDGLTVDQRIELATELTRMSWELAGRPWPSIPRCQWPIRIRALEDDDEAAA